MAQLTISDYKNNLFTSHYLEERLPELDEWKNTEVEEKFDQVKELFQENKEILRKDDGESDTQGEFIDKILKEILGHHFVTEKQDDFGGEILKPDYLFLRNKEHQKDILNSEEKNYFSEAYVVADAKDWDRPLDAGEKTDHSNPKYQIFNYVDRTRIKWGILTNGRKWRLYCYEDLDTKIYYEVDLVNLITKPKDEETLEKFKLFYLFFRQEAFLPRESGFADKVFEGSENYSEELEDDLEDKIYSALEIAGRGFLNTPENDLEKTEENIELAQRSSLILLYRILFILNAESRGLLPVGDKAYDQSLSLEWFKEKILNEPNHAHLQENTLAWDSRMTNLFAAVNSGQDLHSTEIPPYNGGLFDPEDGEENKFLNENKLRGNYLKEIIQLLALRKKEGELTTVDYQALNIRHLGSIYEGLLEHNLQQASDDMILESGEWIKASDSSKDFSEVDITKKVEEGQVYLANNSGERKATGSYYTPDYIVDYIVENTVGPKVEEKISGHHSAEEIQQMENNEKQRKAENQKIAAILDLNICDPAMGSGHFLTEATEYLAKEIYHGVPLLHQDIEEDEDELNWAKRQVVQNCIYGVDINPLAVELGKLSLWIETMAEGKPLNFLDHHLKQGNSLIGSDFEEIFTHPDNKEQKSIENKRFVFGDPERIKKAFKEKYEGIENQNKEETVDQVHQKEEEYREFQNDVLYRQLKQISNLHTRQYFEDEASTDDYESVLSQIGSEDHPFEDTDWFQSAQEDAKNRDYFHWQLEFPKVFFGDRNGFDAVVGNPPWISMKGKEKSGKWSSEYIDYLVNKFDGDSYRPNMMEFFVRLGIDLISTSGRHSFIVPDRLAENKQFSDLRGEMLEIDLESVAFRLEFPNVIADTLVYLVEKSEPSDQIKLYNEESLKGDLKPVNSPRKLFEENKQNVLFFIESEEQKNILLSLLEDFQRLDSVCRTNTGFISAKNKLSDKKESDEMVKAIKGEDITNYAVKGTHYFNPIPENMIGGTQDLDILEKTPQIFVRKTGDRIIAAPVKDQYLPEQSVYQIWDYGNKESLLTACLNSKVIQMLYSKLLVTNRESTPQLKKMDLDRVPVPFSDSEKLEELVRKMNKEVINLESINLDIRDYLGNYSSGKTLGEFYEPAENVSDSILDETTRQKDKLKIEDLEFEMGDRELILKASVRYKPQNTDDFDNLDNNGYTQTYYIPAMKFTGSKKELNLIRYFVPWAVDMEDGDFLKEARKSISPRDRLEDITLPNLDDVEQGLEKFIENREQAEELEEEIKETDELIDAIVFDLYDLTQEEVETVLDSLDTEESEKASILEKFNEI